MGYMNGFNGTASNLYNTGNIVVISSTAGGIIAQLICQKDA